MRSLLDFPFHLKNGCNWHIETFCSVLFEIITDQSIMGEVTIGRVSFRTFFIFTLIFHIMFIASPPEVTPPLVTRSARLDSKVYTELLNLGCMERNALKGTRLYIGISSIHCLVCSVPRLGSSFQLQSCSLSQPQDHRSARAWCHLATILCNGPERQKDENH